MLKSKIILISLVPFLINSAFSAEVRDAKTDTRRMVPLYRISPSTLPTPKRQAEKSNAPDKVNKTGSVRAK